MDVGLHGTLVLQGDIEIFRALIVIVDCNHRTFRILNQSNEGIAIIREVISMAEVLADLIN